MYEGGRAAVARRGETFFLRRVHVAAGFSLIALGLVHLALNRRTLKAYWDLMTKSER